MGAAEVSPEALAFFAAIPATVVAALVLWAGTRAEIAERRLGHAPAWVIALAFALVAAYALLFVAGWYSPFAAVMASILLGMLIGGYGTYLGIRFALRLWWGSLDGDRPRGPQG
jgi:CHASE2 domain-containing sensor protein